MSKQDHDLTSKISVAASELINIQELQDYKDKKNRTLGPDDPRIIQWVLKLSDEEDSDDSNSS